LPGSLQCLHYKTPAHPQLSLLELRPLRPHISAAAPSRSLLTRSRLEVPCVLSPFRLSFGQTSKKLGPPSPPPPHHTPLAPAPRLSCSCSSCRTARRTVSHLPSLLRREGAPRRPTNQRVPGSTPPSSLLATCVLTRQAPPAVQPATALAYTPVSANIMCVKVVHKYGCGHEHVEKATCATSRTTNCNVNNVKTVKHDEKCDSCDR
jgi:hypothetical protein